MPPDAFIRSLGFPESYRVGGSVRDELLGLTPKDGDYIIREVSLERLTEAVRRHGGRPSPLQLRDGRQIGVRANVRGLGPVEISLPRTEVSTGPGHGDFAIVCDPDLLLLSDATRRDFTINALYRHVRTGKVVDPLGGRDALSARVIRTTHANSFRDDPLRILRGLRFVSTLPGFSLSPETLSQMSEHSDACDGLTRAAVSGTVLDELCRLLMGRSVARALRVARDTGVLARLLPELEPMIGFEQESRYHDMTTDEHTFTALNAAAAMHLSLRVRLALLFHDAGKPASAWKGPDGRLHYYESPEGLGRDHEEVGAEIAHATLVRLNAPRSLRRDVVTLVRRHMVPIHGRPKATRVRRWRIELGDELLSDLLKHRLADVMGKGTVDNSALLALAKLEEHRAQAEKDNIPNTTKELPITGHDLIELGLDGPRIGEVQRKLLHEVAYNPRLNDREWLLGRAAKLA